MLDPRSLEKRRDEIAEACERRGASVDLDGAIAAQRRVAALQTALGELNRRKNEHQSGGRVFLFLHTDDFARDYGAFRSRGVEFLEPPREERYGRVAVFRDLYGNRWDLLQPKPTGSG